MYGVQNQLKTVFIVLLLCTFSKKGIVGTAVAQVPTQHTGFLFCLHWKSGM